MNSNIKKRDSVKVSNAIDVVSTKKIFNTEGDSTLKAVNVKDICIDINPPKKEKKEKPDLT